MRDVERLEEENALLRDFVEQHSAYSPDRKIEIQVKQAVLNVKPPMVDIGTDVTDLDSRLNVAPPPSPTRSESFRITRASTFINNGRSSSLIVQPSEVYRKGIAEGRIREHEIQTDQVRILSHENLARKAQVSDAPSAVRDVFDKACGTDLHMLTLQVQKDSASILSEHSIAELKAKYEGQIAIMKESMTKRIQGLETTNEELERALNKSEAENKDLQFDISRNATEINEFQMQISHFRKEGKLLCL
nr:hypothetical protein HK105_005809 [Polyrhizophydium stewartii]